MEDLQKIEETEGNMEQIDLHEIEESEDSVESAILDDVAGDFKAYIDTCMCRHRGRGLGFLYIGDHLAWAGRLEDIR